MAAPTPSHRTQTLAVELLTDWTVREIGVLFAAHELPPPADTVDVARWPVGTSVRRDLAARHHAAIDLTDPVQRGRLLRVYDEMLYRASAEFPAGRAFRHSLKTDGVRLVSVDNIDPEQLRVDVSGDVFEAAKVTLDHVRDPDVLAEHARRMQRALEGQDPADAILAARELIESVCHMVIEDYGERAPKKPSVGQLYGQAADLLGLKAAAIEGDDEASKAAKEVLQGLMSIAVGMGKLRTRVGRGHGGTRLTPARQRHAEMATNAAATLALFVLDTWREKKAEPPRA